MNAIERARLATGRDRSIFQKDYDASLAKLRDEISHRNVLVVGGAGSIGSSTVRLLLPFAPRALHVVDTNENGLAELIRDLRCSRLVQGDTDVRLLPLDYGHPITGRFVSEQRAYDRILNFAAVKHVRSEKDFYSAIHMYDTNVLKMNRFLRWTTTHHGPIDFFSVSTDKAANPVNLMGASKRLMEHLMFSGLPYRCAPPKVTSTRFANVAFSSGSLLESWLNRMEKQQPLSVPAETRRYFISCEEAAQICLMASVCGEGGSILVPADGLVELTLLEDVLTRVLESRSFSPWFFDGEAEAFARMSEALRQRRYPVVRTALDTSGEKPSEEFLGVGESSVACGLGALRAISYASGRLPDAESLESVIVSLERLSSGSALPGLASVSALANLVTQAVPEFAHNATTKTLDGRL